jgi:alpha-L-fucosidase
VAGDTRPGKAEWFLDARFGIFVHWGIYSVLGRGEQVMCRDLMPLSEYEPLAWEFRPPSGWAEELVARAVDAGMTYVVLTARHHDGYCMFDTATTNFNAARTGPGRDLVAEFVEAVRGVGLKVGFYYSLLNWRWRSYWSPTRYADDFPAMVDEIHGQVRELMSSYGKIDLLWYDGGMVPGEGAHGMWGSEPIDVDPAEFFRSAELNAAVRELQPDILMNNRCGEPEDFSTPEQRVTSEGAGRPWETCMTLNYAPGWGYLRHSLANKTAAEVLYNLLDAVRLGGNFLFNVGPRADGSLDAREGSVLTEIGRWMKQHGEAVYGTRPEGIYDLRRGHVQGPMFHYGMWTCRGKQAYLTLFYYPGEQLVVSRIAPRIRSAAMLSTGEHLEVVPISNGRSLIKGLPAEPPDELAPVIKVEFEGRPYAQLDQKAEWLEGRLHPAAMILGSGDGRWPER